MDAIRIHRARQHRSQGPSFLFFALNQRKSVFNLQKYFSQWGMAPDGKFNSPTCCRHSLMGRGDGVGRGRPDSFPGHNMMGEEGILTSLAALGSDTQAKVMSQVETTSAGVLPRRAPSWMNKSHCKSHRS